MKCLGGKKRVHPGSSVVKSPGTRMKDFPAPLDLKKIKVFPLAQRRSLSTIEKTFWSRPKRRHAADSVRNDGSNPRLRPTHQSRPRPNASVMLIYGAHLVKNGLLPVVNQLLSATAGSHISQPTARAPFTTGNFGVLRPHGRKRAGTWPPAPSALGTKRGGTSTSRCWREHCGEGYGRSLGRFIVEDGVTLPTRKNWKLRYVTSRLIRCRLRAPNCCKPC
jgi:hypothetical protein